MFGQQPISQRRSSPSYGFGTGTRGHAAKVFMGPEHAKTYNYGISTRHGVPYNAIDAVGPQQDSGKNSPPVWNFGTAERFRNTGRQSALLPGPGTYENDSSIGRQTLSNRSSGQRFGFGTVDRDMASRVFVSPTFAKNYHGLNSPGPAAMYAMHSQMTGPHYGFGTEQRGDHRHEKAKAGLPGPGAYDMDSTLGSQSSSAIPTAACFGFGSSNREQSARLFISQLHSSTNGGAHSASPGPSMYTLNPSIGKQMTSRGKTASSWGFGKANRFKNVGESGTPGPGAYAI